MKKLYVYIFLSFVLGQVSLYSQRNLENLDRGLVAVQRDASNVFLSWRRLGTDPDSTSFNIYYNGALLVSTAIDGASNYVHNTTEKGSYYIRPVFNGAEQLPSDTVSPWAQGYLDIDMVVPAGGTTPDGVSYTYSPNDCSVGDVDADGEYEIIVKWDPSNSKDNSHSGYTGNVYIDAYKFDGTHLWRIDLGINIRAGAHYTQLMVFDLDNDGKAEVACKTAPGTVDGTGNYLSDGPAATDDDDADYRNTSGRILSGPEYLTVFNGETGEEMVTTSYTPQRGKVCDWGDCYGNRVDRFLAAIAYLDGVNPSLVMCRGYYTRTVLAAYNWDGTTLSKEWVFDSDNGYPTFAGQGNHNLSVADVDGDGKDEIVYGSCTVDHDGSGLYSTGLGHGDAIHVSDLDPDIPGLEVFMPHENKTEGITFRKTSNGEVIWEKKSPDDVGRGLSADVVAGHKGAECWSTLESSIYNNMGEDIGSRPSSINFAIWWDGDNLRELLNGVIITKYGVGTLFGASGCSSNNGSKSTPNLQADILGDWREEVILRTSDNSKLRVFTTTKYTPKALYTLMHDPVYRLGVAWQNTGYNQPPHTFFHFGGEMQEPPFSPIRNNKLIWVSGSDWDLNTSSNWEKDNLASSFNNGDDVLFDITSSNLNNINIVGNLRPGSVSVNSPDDFAFEGSGDLSGYMSLKKNGSGNLKVNNTLTYQGPTKVWGGSITVNDSLPNSEMTIYKHSTLQGSGVLSNTTVKDHGIVSPGNGTASADSLTINGDLYIEANAILKFDLSDDTTGLSKQNDIILVKGNLTFEKKVEIQINLLNDSLTPGTYKLIRFDGTFTGNLENITIKNIEGTIYELHYDERYISILIYPPRTSSKIIWKGGLDNGTWDLGVTKNWYYKGIEEVYVDFDTVLFDDTAIPNTIVNLSGDLTPSEIEVQSSSDYFFRGNGQILGSGNLVKNGSGKLGIEVTNQYTGKTIINKGTISVSYPGNTGEPGPLGASDNSGAGLEINGGTLKISTSSSTDRNIYLGPSGGSLYLSNLVNVKYTGSLTGPGTLKKNGSGTFDIKNSNEHLGGLYILYGKVSLSTETAIQNGVGTGPVILKAGTLSLSDCANTCNASWDLEVPTGANAKLILGKNIQLSGNLTGDGTLNIYTTSENIQKSELLGDWSMFEGTVNATADDDGGWLLLGNKAGYGKATINLGNNVLALYRHTSNDTVEIGTLAGVPGSRLGAGGDGAANITWKIGGLNKSFDFDGIIEETQVSETGATTSLIKTGTGVMTLNSANSYSGPTTIEQGKLLVNNSIGSGTGQSNILVLEGGTLGGSGSIDGKLTIDQDGVISPGNEGVGDFTIRNNAVLGPGSIYLAEVNTSTLESDKLIVLDTLILNAILYLSLLRNNEFKDGDSIKIIEAGKIEGNFSSIIPKLPANNLNWDQSRLHENGCIYIKGNNDIDKVDPTGLTNFNIFPNPTKGKFFIETSTPSNLLKVYLKTLDGISIYSKEIRNTGTSFPIDCSSIFNGMYILTLILDGKLSTKKLIVQN